MFGYWVVSLFINALPELIKKQAGETTLLFKTLNGKLFLFDRQCKSTDLQIQAWQVRLGKDRVLAMRRTTFKRFDKTSFDLQKKNAKKNGEAIWAFDKTIGTLMRLSQPIEEALQSSAPLFIQGVIHHDNVHVKAAPFFEFVSEKRFNQSRVGLYHQIEELVRRFASRWISIEPFELKLDQRLLTNTPGYWKNRVTDWLQTIDIMPICIVDMIKTDESIDITRLLCNQIETILPKLPSPNFTSAPMPEALNIVLLHEPEWYDKMKQQDQYINNPSCICQHVTIENIQSSFQNNSKTEILVCLKELCLKHDLTQRIAAFTDWHSFGFLETYTFATMHFPSGRDREGRCSVVTIQPDGRIESETYSTFSDDIQVRPMPYIYDQAQAHGTYIKKNIENYNYHLEGAVINGRGSINLIYRTEMTTMPNQKQLSEALGKTFGAFPKQLSSPRDLSTWIRGIFKEPTDHPWDTLRIDSLLQEIHKESKPFDQALLLKTLKAAKWKNNKERAFLCEKLQSEFAISLQLSRSKANKESFFSFKTNLRYKQIGEDQLIYVVGYQDNVALKQSFSKASHFRHVFAPEGNSLFFENLFPTFDDNSIRLDENTVLPLAFKYVREI
jgi:hypothetical protein